MKKIRLFFRGEPFCLFISGNADLHLVIGCENGALMYLVHDSMEIGRLTAQNWTQSQWGKFNSIWETHIFQLYLIKTNC